jgi:hypothetical protein
MKELRGGLMSSSFPDVVRRTLIQSLGSLNEIPRTCGATDGTGLLGTYTCSYPPRRETLESLWGNNTRRRECPKGGVATNNAPMHAILRGRDQASCIR